MTVEQILQKELKNPGHGLIEKMRRLHTNEIFKKGLNY
jgi:hypothetical protein